MKKLTDNQIKSIEVSHNVYVDAESMMYNVGGGYDATYGWMPIPQAWIDEDTGDSGNN